MPGLSELREKHGMRNPKGVIHVGAHECEEYGMYKYHELKEIHWVEAMPDKVQLCRARGIPNVHCAIIGVTDGSPVTFNVTNSTMSSSVHELGEHVTEHPEINVVRRFASETKRLDTLVREKHIPMTKINYMSIDVQGSELNVLRSMGPLLDHIDYIHSEVSEKAIYIGGVLINDLERFLNMHGFRRRYLIMTRHGWGDAFYIRCQKHRPPTNLAIN